MRDNIDRRVTSPGVPHLHVQALTFWSSPEVSKSTKYPADPHWFVDVVLPSQMFLTSKTACLLNFVYFFDFSHSANSRDVYFK